MGPASSLNVNISKFLTADVPRKHTEKYLCTKLMKMLEEGLHTDITLKAQGGSVNAHRGVLASASPVFDAMFKHEMQEHLTSTVDLPDMTIEGLQLFLFLLYVIPDNDLFLEVTMEGFELEVLDRHFGELITACTMYQVTGPLPATLTCALPRNLSCDNCWKYLSMCTFPRSSHSFDYWRDAYRQCHHYIVSNFYLILESDAILSELRENPEFVLPFMKKALLAGTDCIACEEWNPLKVRQD